MPKKLVVFCDGTWNDVRMAQLTNVARLAKCVSAYDPVARMSQIIFYDEGVGVSSAISKTVDKGVKLLGGALGRGLDRKVEAAYRFLVLNYEPDDEIYIFGFSRGAYTARSLAGLIRKCGILKTSCFDQIPAAMSIYRDARHPKDPTVVDFRERFGHPRSAGAEDDEWVSERIGKEEPAAISDERGRAWQYQHRKPHSYRMMFLGVWDTVGSLGVPQRFKMLQGFNKKYQFHDTNLSSLISSARHAVSIEEDRNVFDVTPMDGLLQLNVEWASARNWDVANPDDPRHVPYHLRPYQQVRFPGDHGAVGGGNAEIGLSSAALLWIAEGAVDAGLTLEKDPTNELFAAVASVNPMANWRIKKNGQPKGPNEFDLLGWVGGHKWRGGPANIDETSLTARLRWCADPTWRPYNLSVLKLLSCPAPALPPAPQGFPKSRVSWPQPTGYP